MMKTYAIFLLTFFLFACKDNQTKEINNPKENIDWDTFKIKVDDQSITVPFNQDTCYFFQIFRDTLYFKEHKEFKSESQKFTLTKAERDSLRLWAIDAITKPVAADQTVTDYAGKYISISLSFSNTKISCGYSSIDAWTGISPILYKINSLTFDKLKK